MWYKLNQYLRFFILPILPQFPPPPAPPHPPRPTPPISTILNFIFDLMKAFSINFHPDKKLSWSHASNLIGSLCESIPVDSCSAAFSCYVLCFNITIFFVCFLRYLLIYSKAVDFCYHGIGNIQKSLVSVQLNASDS